MWCILLSNIFIYARKCLQEMWRKCTWNVTCPSYRKCAWNFMCPGLGNVPEILPYTAPGNVKEMSKFPGVGNAHAINKKCEVSSTFHGISLPRKFRISSSCARGLGTPWEYTHMYYVYNCTYYANAHTEYIIWVLFYYRTYVTVWVKTSLVRTSNFTMLRPHKNC